MSLTRRELFRTAVGGAGLAAGARRSNVWRLDAQTACDATSVDLDVRRLVDQPIITSALDPSIGHNIQGPSLIRVPSWVSDPLGRYYLYFADHKGRYIRLAYADALEGPWTVHRPGSLHIEDSYLPTEPSELTAEERGQIARAPDRRAGVPSAGLSWTLPHIASPDVHVREDRREIVMYYHGLVGFRQQRSRAAVSSDGITFEARPEILGRTYMRAFSHDGWWYVMAMPGVFYRSKDGLSDFEEGPQLFPGTMRHAALYRRGTLLFVFWSNVGDDPERIIMSTVDLAGDWSTWQASARRDVLQTERPWEGADQPRRPSVRDAINIPVHEVRDPAIYVEDDRLYLLYSVAGEAGIAIAELTLRCPPAV